MTIMTTTFIPCGAKLPFIAMVAGAIFGGASWVAPSAYFLGIAAIICSGIILKKTKMFAGDPAPFVMELPAYHMPTIGSVLRSMWERGWSFIKKLVRLSWYLPSLYGSQLTLVSWTANSRCFPKTRLITVFWLRSVKQSAGSSFHRDGATGRQPLHLLQVWLQREHCWYTGHPLRRRRRKRLRNHGSSFHSSKRIFLLGIQPAVCTVLRSYGCDQT